VRKTAVELKRALFDKELMFIYQDWLALKGEMVPVGSRERAGSVMSSPGSAAGTLAEKIIAAHAHQGVRPGQIVVADVDVALAQDGTGPLPSSRSANSVWVSSGSAGRCSSSITPHPPARGALPTRR